MFHSQRDVAEVLAQAARSVWTIPPAEWWYPREVGFARRRVQYLNSSRVFSQSDVKVTCGEVV